MSTFAPPPTASELRTLAALPASHPSQLPDVLPDFAASVSPDWVRDFLFAAEPLHLAALTAPTLPATACALALTTTRIEAPAPQPAPYPAESQYFRSRCLLAPSFTASGITVGVGVLEAATGPAETPPVEEAPNLRLTFRFARDSDRQSLLLVSDEAAADTVTVFVSRHPEPSRSHSFTACFRRRELLAALDGAATRADIAAVALFTLSEVHTRPCPVCAALSGCRCAQIALRPRHPFDFLAFRAGLLQGFGMFEGVGCKVVRDEGGVVRNASLGVRVARESIVDSDLVRRLSKWSVSTHLRARKEDPLQSALFAKASSPLLPTDRDEREREASLDDAGLWMSTDMSTDVFENEGDALFLGLPLGASSPHSPDFAIQEVVIQDAADEVVIPSLSYSESLIGLDDGKYEECAENEATQEIKAEPTDADSEHGADDPWWDKLCEAGVPQKCANSCISEPKLAEPESSVVPSSGTIQKSCSSEAIVVSGLMQKPDSQNCSDANAAKDAAKRRLRAARKERNRASAQRSNMRRKAEKDAMQLELQRLHEKVGLLRKREVSLRLENMTLRRSFVQQ